jgi:hypothetical protein
MLDLTNDRLMPDHQCQKDEAGKGDQPGRDNAFDREDDQDWNEREDDSSPEPVAPTDRFNRREGGLTCGEALLVFDRWCCHGHLSALLVGQALLN